MERGLREDGDPPPPPPPVESKQELVVVPLSWSLVIGLVRRKRQEPPLPRFSGPKERSSVTDVNISIQCLESCQDLAVLCLRLESFRTFPRTEGKNGFGVCVSFPSLGVFHMKFFLNYTQCPLNLICHRLCGEKKQRTYLSDNLRVISARFRGWSREKPGLPGADCGVSQGWGSRGRPARGLRAAPQPAACEIPHILGVQGDVFPRVNPTAAWGGCARVRRGARGRAGRAVSSLLPPND